MPASSLDATLFRSVMSTFADTVAVVTARHSDGTPRGLTSTAVCPVSADPPMLLVCVGLGSRTLPAIVGAGGFAVNVLREGRAPLADRFARSLPSDEKFAAVRWHYSPDDVGAPLLDDDALAHVVCTVDSSLIAGDHRVLVGAVRTAAAAGDGLPLLYHRREFARLAAPHGAQQADHQGGDPCVSASTSSRP